MGWKHATCATRRASSPVVLPSRSKRAKGGRLVLRWRRRRLKLQPRPGLVCSFTVATNGVECSARKNTAEP
ncbi:hypothetical protein MUK42_32523 [Musa troglodytarum]|uniref:Uncharacterized protein n=1 Tax=Musa troglodytarum TaxID=320322 RepID=A0A9E7GKY6_9LILI|nr:hypothetical protein MUK42_32523 [Musa troglodytarum]